jgi:hypothetical protein
LPWYVGTAQTERDVEAQEKSAQHYLTLAAKFEAAREKR